MQKQQLRNNKIKGRKIKNMPMFILIGLIAMIVIIAIIYYVFLRYSPEQIITYSGYAIEGKTMAENLKSSEISNIDQYLNLIEVKENDLLYKKLNSYYIGENDKKEIDINYPMYINDGDTLFNISKNTKLITVNYEEVEGYPEFMLTGGVMYNGVDLTRADGNKYIFLKSEDEIYTNVQAIKIKTATNEYEIKEYSNIYFTEEAITYYEMQDGYMEYKRIADIDNNSEIEVNGEILTYKIFLERLGIIQSDEQNENNNRDEEVNEIVENSTVDNETSTEDENNKNNIANETEEWQEGMWARPEVSCTDFESDVYTIRTNLTVTDRAGVITRGVIFEISLDGRLNRRVQATKAGELEITGLQPDTEYEIVGIVYYNDESGVEVEEEFYTGSVTTKSIETLGTIDFSFENGEIYSNKIELIHLKINNDVNEEVIKGISRIQIEIGDVAYRLSNDEVKQIKAGEEITYQTSETLTSNSRIRYEITAFDKFGNELKEINNTGETITSKQMPTASIKATKQDVTEVNLEVTLTNKDNVTLENYRYEVINQSGDKVKEGQLEKDTETLVFTDLDPNGYYQIIIYGDYDLENGDGKQANQELGRGSFVTRPIASLGYMQVKIDDKEVTQNEIKLGISIDENQTDARLIAILDKVEIVIYDEGKNIDNDKDIEEQVDNEIQRITLTKEEVEQLKVAEEVEIKLEQLTSNTKYKIDVITTVKQGSVEEVVEDKQNLSEVITLKMPAEVQIRNQFVIGDMIDLDIRVEDIDGAVLTNNVRIEVRDEENKLINLSEMDTNGDYKRKVYENLEENTTYRIIIYAPQYNEGSTDKTYEADYILKEIEIYTEAGISGRLNLLSLEKTPSGKNLIDVSSKVNWFVKCFDPNYAYGLNYDENSGILTLGGTTGYGVVNYYDLEDYLGQEITISFKARTEDSTSLSIIEKSNLDMLDTDREVYQTISRSNLSHEWQEYSYTVTLSKTGYIGFNVTVAYAVVEIQDLQIELGNTKTSYEEFKYTYNANVGITVNDTRDEITTNDYYVRIYRNNEQVEEIRYEELEEENKVENVSKLYEVDIDASYKIELLVKIGDRYYELDSQEFTTESGKEIKGISNINDFLKIQPYGEYIVLNDLDLSGAQSATYRFGNSILEFNGRIDFNGRKIIKDIKNNPGQVFYILGAEGIIENLVFDIKMNNDLATSATCFMQYNYGTIKNIQINLLESTENLNNRIILLCQTNTGIVENFIVNFEEHLYTSTLAAIITESNNGIIRNGYMYGENIVSLSSTDNSTSSGIVISNQRNGVIENVFTLVSMDSIYSFQINSNIAYANYDTATVQNVYSVGVGMNTTDNLSYGPNIRSIASKNIYNNYYFADEIFTSELETKGNKLSLWDAEFQNQIINNDGAFLVDELVNDGFYPQLIMPDCMPVQEYIELPEVEDADLPDILSTKILEQGTNTVKVEFSVNNPSAETISNIQIENLEVEILSQEYSNEKSAVIAELKNPTICVSSYNVLSLSTKGAFNNSYTRSYEEGERVINVDLYREIWNVEDWKNIDDSPTENYMLMSDLNFINEGTSVRIGSLNGILNGNGYSISNIYLTGNTSLIGSLYGTLENLYINNFNQEVTAQGGLITTANSGSVIDNVHLKDIDINKSSDGAIGGLVGFGTYINIRNSSVTNIKITIYGADDYLNVGGMIGEVNNSLIQNCYVKGLDISDCETVIPAIGGLAGYASEVNTIESCYVEGKINSENSNIGGIAGNLTTNGSIVQNCYSKVYISTSSNNVGGIVGTYQGSSLDDIKNNLSIGNIYSTQGENGLNRIVGSNEETSSNNFAYENQLVNGYVNSEEKGAKLLDKTEVLSLDLGDSFEYTDIESQILPKLYNINGITILPNQEDIFIDDSTSKDHVNLKIDSIEVTKPNTTEAEINIRINNPDEIKITGIEIEDMTSSVTRTVTENGITSITVRSTPERFYDSYKLTEIRYEIENSEDEQIKDVEAKVKVQFYKEIYTYEDWQSIEEGTYQNYRLMADIDFSGKTNVKNNITVNRLEAENNVYTLKNINLEFNEANCGLIKSIKTNIKNIGFENITIINTANSGSYCGVIATSSGTIENLEFKNILIEAKEISTVGIIGFVRNGNIKIISLNTVNITGKEYVAGLVGRCDYEISNIDANKVNITASGNNIGGVVGYSSNTLNPEHIYINISDSTIISEGNYVGGITGFNYQVKLTNSSVKNTSVTGNSYVGGMSGSNLLSANYYTYYNTVDNCNIYGSDSYIGGLSGRSSVYEEYPSITNTNVYGTTVNSDYVGGLARIYWING